MEPEKKHKYLPVLITIFVMLLLTAGAVTGVWYYMDQQAENDKAELQAQIDELRADVDNDTTEEVADTEEDETAGWASYTNTYQGFSLKYPSDWILTETAGGATLKKGNEGFGVTGFENPNGLDNEEWLAEEIKNGNIGEDVQSKSTKTIGDYQVLTLQDNGIITRYVYILGEDSKILEVANYTAGISDATKSVIEGVIKTIKFN